MMSQGFTLLLLCQARPSTCQYVNHPDETCCRLCGPDDMLQPVGLAYLPAELATAVVELLSPRDIFLLRLVSKRLADLTAPFFRPLFSKRCVSLERDSLLNLCEISRHPTLRHAVHTVKLCTDHLPAELMWPRVEIWDSELVQLLDEIDYPDSRDFPDDYPFEFLRQDDDGFGHGRASTRLYDDNGRALVVDGAARLRRPAFRRRLADQDYLHTSGLGARLLAEALRNLPACRVVGINDFARPWGTAALARDVGSLPHRLISDRGRDNMPFLYTIVPALLTAVATSGISLDEIYMIPGSTFGQRSALLPGMLAPDGVTLPANSVSRLCLVVTAVRKDDEHDETPTISWVQLMVDFIGAFCSLTTLVLTLHIGDTGLSLSGLSCRLFIPRLESVTLQEFTCTRADLLYLLGRHRTTLRNVTLRYICLVKETGLWGEETVPWPSVIRSLRDDFTLDTLTMSPRYALGTDIRCDGRMDNRRGRAVGEE
ncbi:hypothetical protein LX36DRAFT_737798 [Colletotrichum falcatum]|nr:hypothetical protein LX36DRAFT_737798 [Colletotrichum falcatum]